MARNQIFAKVSFSKFIFIAGKDGRTVFITAIHHLNDMQLLEQKEQMERLSRGGAEKAAAAQSGKEWSADELSLLVKAVNLFPAGNNLFVSYLFYFEN